METMTLFVVWLSLLTALVCLMAVCSAYFAWWYISLRNPQITKLIVEAYQEKDKDKLK
ncbi:MAG: hypothetical protein GY751_10435 [Bacteroidetes bacterium]|jgi:hypothetical protein|nr:hypothetical protein [Bacteroidota bacterium]|tara:strand:+ start:575 stop:748 length:174 start_codon:yes stop_codon:yes gene_type:complete